MLASLLNDFAIKTKKKKQRDKTRLDERSLDVLMKNLPKYEDPDMFAFVPIQFLENIWQRAAEYDTLNTETAPLFYHSNILIYLF